MNTLYVVHFNDGSTGNYFADSYDWDLCSNGLFSLTSTHRETDEELTIMFCPTNVIHHVDHMQSE